MNSQAMLSDIVPTVFLGPGTKNPKCVSCKPQKPQGQRMKTSLYQSSHMKNPGHCAPGLQLIKQVFTVIHELGKVQKPGSHHF
mmetsp:Transcript_2890/g.7537  ORF Transcript_2890/g.7537 Transcript_2890/m.7537 type:complete len:83 (-) Transcript_2890:1408-1656(-)